MTETIRIGTRGSDLALAQSAMVAAALREAHPGVSVELITIRTTGDKRQGTPEAALLDKKAWILELEQAIISGDVDLAVHSGKDVPLGIDEKTAICSILKREQPFDSFIGRKSEDGTRITPADLKSNAVVGTASLRRAASLRRWLVDSSPVEHRGNVPTRLRKLDESDTLDGIILASAGLRRLPEHCADLDHHPLPVEQFVPAIAQGTLVAQFRKDDPDTRAKVSAISDPATEVAFVAERACATVLDADCTTAVGIYAAVDLESESITLTSRVLSLDGIECIETTMKGSSSTPAELGTAIGNALVEKGANRILKAASAG